MIDEQVPPALARDRSVSHTFGFVNATLSSVANSDSINRVEESSKDIKEISQVAKGLP